MTAVDAHLAYTRPADVYVDADRLRARTLAPEANGAPRSYDLRPCRVLDCSAPGGLRPDLREHGFAHADLSHLPQLQALLARIHRAGRVSPDVASQLRRALTGRSLRLSGGDDLRLLFIAPEGLIIRRAGPNGLQLHAGAARRHIHHDAATEVHADQDVDGTPLRQILRGAAPSLFHHDSPDRANRHSRLHLVNLWIPLSQVTRPLALMDRRTLDRRTHQLRYGLPVDDFLQRREDMRVNDIWTFLYDQSQQWYFSSTLDSRTAYVFETLSTPHGSFILPGEARAESRHRRLSAAIAAIHRRDPAALDRALEPADDGSAGEPATAPLRRVIADMDAVLATARAHAHALARGEGALGWCTRAAAAADVVVRTSLEMRAVGLRT